MKGNVAYDLYRLANKLYLLHVPIIPYVIEKILRFVFNAVIHPETKIGSNVHFTYDGLGIVIHRRCIIGDNVRIGNGVTLGARRRDQGAPLIGDNVFIGAGAKVLGGVKIGNNAKIGANAVVLNDVPDNATAVGVPARVIKVGK